MVAFIGSWIKTVLSAVVNFWLSTNYRLLWQHQLSPALAAGKRALVNIGNYSGWNNFYKLLSKTETPSLYSVGHFIRQGHISQVSRLEVNDKADKRSNQGPIRIFSAFLHSHSWKVTFAFVLSSSFVSNRHQSWDPWISPANADSLIICRYITLKDCTVKNSNICVKFQSFIQRLGTSNTTVLFMFIVCQCP